MQRQPKVADALEFGLVRQGQQPPDLTLGKAFAREPVEVVVRQVGLQNALMLAEGLGGGDVLVEVMRMHLATGTSANTHRGASTGGLSRWLLRDLLMLRMRMRTRRQGLVE